MTWYIWHPPIRFLLKQAIKDRVLRGLSRGMLRLIELLTMQIANDAVNINNDILGIIGLYRLAINHLDNSDTVPL